MLLMDYTKTQVIDVVITKQDGTRGLVMAIPEPWDGSREQETYLADKLRSYVTYADGQLGRDFPDSVGSRVDIDLYCATQPTPEVEAILDAARGRLLRPGMRLNVESLPPEVVRAYLSYES
jgi:hypothetical protein